MEFIADRVIGLLGSLASQELELITNFQDDVETMKSMFSAIKAVLRDAEKKAISSDLIKDWLKKLKAVLLDAEDLLDAYSTDELAREVMTQGKSKVGKEVRIFFSKSNRTVCAAKMGHQIKALKKKLESIFKEKKSLHLSEISSIDESYHEWRQTHSFVREEDVVGREAEKKSLVNAILDSKVANDNITVAAIVGFGGLGKTTLAQQVYNDKAIEKHFKLMKWVCVADESTDNQFSIRRVALNIIGKKKYRKSEKEEVVQVLRNTIEGKRFLLVLDDVWNEEREKWLELESLLRGGGKGSVIIVTTRSEKVAQIMGTHSFPHVSLTSLDEKNSWELFRRVAFREGNEPENQELVRIGKDIVGKCGGVPLAIRIIGSLMFNQKPEVREWSNFRDSELANIDSIEGNKIMSILKLSYDHLPSHLKSCFAFCSRFPKDCIIGRERIIQLWMAEGFIQPLDKNWRLEEVGDTYYMQLISRCLFQDVQRDDFGGIESCKMHDLMHDLSKSISKTECCVVTGERVEKENIGDGIRHVLIHDDRGWKFEADNNVNIKIVRTILTPIEWWNAFKAETPPEYAVPYCERMKNLRVLDLSCYDLKRIPKSIGELKLLRYLDLSGNGGLEELPREITRLHNLVTLKLNCCFFLRQLPRGMERLVNLRHLEMKFCFNFKWTPFGLGSLTNLQTMTMFAVGDWMSGGAKISELRDLICLRGELIITALATLRINMKEVESSKFLVNTKHLETLDLFWEPFWSEEEHKEDEIILEALEPPHTIKSMRLFYFCGGQLSEWICSLTSLTSLRFCDCKALASLPESFGNLTSLQRLDIDGCSALASLPESIGNLTSLQRLDIVGCSTLASLPESIGNLTSLQELILKGCSALASLPESIKSLTSLTSVDFRGCHALTERYGLQLQGFHWPALAHIEHVYFGGADDDGDDDGDEDAHND